MGTIKKLIIAAIILFLLVIGSVIWSDDPLILPSGYEFCNRQGFESTAFLGAYNERIGKVECISCYKGNCEHKEFDVIKKFGRILVAK